MNIKLSQIEEENNKLKEKERNYINELENLKNKMDEEIKIKNGLIESNKKLQEKIELLNHQLNSFKLEYKKDQEEYNNMYKV